MKYWEMVAKQFLPAKTRRVDAPWRAQKRYY